MRKSLRCLISFHRGDLAQIINRTIDGDWSDRHRQYRKNLEKSWTAVRNELLDYSYVKDLTALR